MTDSPDRACPPAGNRALEQHTTPADRPVEPPNPPDPPPSTACVDRRRPKGPAAADAGTLRALLDSAAYFDAPRDPAENPPRKDQPQGPRLTGPAPSGMTSTFTQRRVYLVSGAFAQIAVVRDAVTGILPR